MVAAFAVVSAFVRTGGGQVKVVLFGATGMVGQGVLRECLLDPDVETVLAIVRNPNLPQHEKLREIVHQDVSDLSSIEDKLSGYEACFFLPWRLGSGNEGGGVSAIDIRPYGVSGSYLSQA
jgi:uncharacterized protein YbjT (DUF2867 family)